MRTNLLIILSGFLLWVLYLLISISDLHESGQRKGEKEKGKVERRTERPRAVAWRLFPRETLLVTGRDAGLGRSNVS